MAANSRALVQLAAKHEIAILALCQINRERDAKNRAEDDRFKMPSLGDLKGGSTLEHDCEFAWNICPLDSTYTTLRLDIPKLRGLAGGEIRLEHEPAYNRTIGKGHLIGGTA
jgi:hypothetical protein